MAKIVDKATMAPGSCVATGDIDGPFFDLGRWSAIDPRVGNPYLYLQVAFVEELGRQLNMVPADEVRVLEDRLDEMDQEIQKLHAVLDATQTLEKALAQAE